MKVAKRVGAALLVLLCAGLLVGFKTDLLLADIRPADLGAPASGRKTMPSIHRAHGDAARWYALQRVTLEMEGTWDHPAPRWAQGPFLSDEPRIRLSFAPAVYGDAKLESLDTNESFEVRDGVALAHADGSTRPGPRQLRLFVDSIRHLVEMPFAMQTTTVQRSTAASAWNGEQYRRVFATWGDFAPNPDVDQYILWQNESSGLLERFDATGRFISPFAQACVELSDHVIDGGFVLPRHITVNRGEQPGDRLMTWRVVSVDIEHSGEHATP